MKRSFFSLAAGMLFAALAALSVTPAVAYEHLDRPSLVPPAIDAQLLTIEPALAVATVDEFDLVFANTDLALVDVDAIEMLTAPAACRMPSSRPIVALALSRCVVSHVLIRGSPPQ